jgi:hypothetical protein
MVQFGPNKRGNMLLMPMNRDRDSNIYLTVKHLPKGKTFTLRYNIYLKVKHLLEGEPILFHESGNGYKYLPEGETFT